MVTPCFLFKDIGKINRFAKKDKNISSFCLFIWKTGFRIVYLHQVFIVLDF